MDESHERDESLSHRQQAEGVRIIRAEEAQAALDAGQAAGRRPEDAPRFGDVPAAPAGPRSPHRFPLPDSVDPASVPKPAVRPPERRFGGRLTNRNKPVETVRAPSPPRVVRVLPADTVAEPLAEASGKASPVPADAGWGEGAGWSEDTVPRPRAPEPMSVGAKTEGPKHFAKDPVAAGATGWSGSDAEGPIGVAAAAGSGDWPGTSAVGRPGSASSGDWPGTSAGAGKGSAGLGGWQGMSAGGGQGTPGSGDWQGGSAAEGGQGAGGGSSDRFTASLDPPRPPMPSPGWEPSAPPPLPPDLSPPDEGINVHTGAIPQLQHWTDPPTGEVPYILPDREPSQGEEMAAWQALGSRGLRWRDEASDWDDLEDVSQLGSDEPRLGALDTTRTEHSDMFSFDEQFERLEDERSGAPPVVEAPMDEPLPPSRPAAREPNRRPVGRRPTPVSSRNAPRANPAALRPRGGSGGGGGIGGGGTERDLPAATIVGVAMILALCVTYFLGAAVLMLLCAVVVTASALELYNLIQHRGFRPATLLGVCATLAVMLAAYWRGEGAVPLILALVFVTTMLWYMVGVVEARPVVNIGLTVMAFVWVGVFGSYAPALLALPRGKQLLLLPVLVTVAADTAAFFAGRSIGNRPLAPAISPGKTWEGVIAGGAGAIVISYILSRLPFLSKTWSGEHALLLGLVVAIVAPLGDLCESMVKRDLDLKDSGSVLPGHGGLLDRFDGLLFVLPATYYLLLYLKLI